MAENDVASAQQNLAAAQYAHRNDPQNVIDRLKASLPKMHDGGVVPKDGAYNLQEGETVTPAPDAQNDSAVSDEAAVSGESVNLQRAYSKLNSAIAAMLDGLGIRRASTISHVAGES